MHGRFTILAFSIVSMIMQPVAYGQQQANWAAEAIKRVIQENTKNGKPLTVEEFWEKNQENFHPHWQREFKPSIYIQRNERVPKMEVMTINLPQGKKSARIMMEINGKTVSVEYLGGSDKFIRFNNTMISYQDFIYVEGMMKKLEKDPVVAAETKRIEKKALKAPTFPSYEAWSKMTAYQRAAYFVNLRLVTEAAAKVLEKKAQKETAQNSTLPWIELFLEKAHAQKQALGKSCLVGGWVGSVSIRKSDKRIVCDAYEAVIENKGKNAVQSKVMQGISGCGRSSFPCNPFVFGYNRSGSGPICVPYDSGFQTATSQCGSKSPLRMTDTAQLAKDTEAMIKSLLKQEGKDGNDYFKDGKVISKDKWKELHDSVVKDFDNFIAEGVSYCDSSDYNLVQSKVDPEQASACDTLRNRKLAFQRGLSMLEPKPEEVQPKPEPAPSDDCEKDGQKGKKDPNDPSKCIVPTPPAPPTPAPAPTPVPPPVAADPCQNPNTTVNGKRDCVPVAAALPGSVAKTAAPASAGFNWKPFAVGGIIAVLLALLFKDKKANLPGPQPGPSPVAPPLPAPPPQPTPDNPAPPITPTMTPITPVTPPGSSEGGGTTGGPSAGGANR